MAVKVNLLPKELTGTKKIVKIARGLNVAAVVGISSFLVLGAVGAFLIYLKTTELGDLRIQGDTLKTTISGLETAETRLVLVKDRVAKVQLILDDRLNEEAFRKQKDLADSLPEGVSFAEIEVGSDKTSFGVISTGSVALRAFFDQLLTKNYTNLVLESINFNTFLGYQVLLNLE